MRHLLFIFGLLSIAYGQNCYEPTTPLYPICQDPQIVALAPGQNIPNHDLCKNGSKVTEVYDLIQAPHVLLVTGSASDENTVASLRGLDSLKQSGINVQFIYTTEAYPQGEVTPYGCFFHSNPNAVAAQYDMMDRESQADSLLHMYSFDYFVDDSAQGFWSKFGQYPHTAFLFVDGELCKSWNIFRVDEFWPAWNNCANAVGIRDEINETRGLWFDPWTGRSEIMTWGQFLSRGGWFYFQGKKYLR